MNKREDTGSIGNNRTCFFIFNSNTMIDEDKEGAHRRKIEKGGIGEKGMFFPDLLLRLCL